MTQSLFSNYYVIERLEQDYPEWQAMAANMKTLRPIVEHIIAQAPLCTSVSSMVRAPTKQETTQHLVRPLLEALGWQIHPAQEQEDYYDLNLQIDGNHVAMCSVVPAEQPLDRPVYRQQAADNAQDDTPSSPDMRMIAALKHGEPHGRMWGIVTNGTVWRLMGSIASAASGVYYEVDVRHLLNLGQPKDLRFFAAFFSPAGLAKPAPDTDALVTRIYHSGQSHAQEVGENLKATIFAHVFVDLATGLGEAVRRSDGYADSEEELHLLYRATLILLYRLLFLLYAESRHLLPTMHSAYYPHSLTNLLKHIALNRSHLISPDQRNPLGPLDTWIWEHLQALFAAIESGKPAWGVPRYNGGLFSDTATDAHALLANLTDVGAASLAPALDGFARDRLAQTADTTNDALRFIDYLALDVRHLGSIYETLLEFQLRRATSPMVLHKGQWVVNTTPSPLTRESIEPPSCRQEHQDSAMDTPALPPSTAIREKESKARQPTTNIGQLYLENTRQERKASGSYYTPDYIVHSIVEYAVGPVFAKRERLFDDRMNQLRTKRTARRRAQSSDEAQLLDREIAALERETSDTLLDLKILDPAMGGGHFLVSAVDYLSDRIIAVLERYPDDNTIYPQFTKMRASIKERMQAQGIADMFIRDEQLTNRTLLRHIVTKRCIYGVDLNEFAVELARLSLWLHSCTVGVPLSFLDHHLKCGNSLIGTHVKAVEQELKTDQFSSPFAGLFSAMKHMTTLVQIADVTYDKLEHSEQLYHVFAHSIAPYKTMLDIWVSHHFHNKHAREFLTLFQGNTLKALDGTLAISQNHQDAIAQGRELAKAKSFFHWDLEFPEVFVDLQRGQWKDEHAAGFDAVIGNPPWVSFSGREGKELCPQTVSFYTAQYQCSAGWLALHTLFGEKAFNLLNKSGYHAFIVPDQVGHLEQYASFRRLFIAPEKPPQATYLRHAKYTGEHVFAHVVSPTMIYLVSKTAFSTWCVTNKEGETRELDCTMLSSQPRFRWICDPRFELWAKIQRISLTLAHAFGDPGVHTGNCSKKLIVSPAQKLSIPILQGSDIDMYTIPHAHAHLNLHYTPTPGDYYTIRDCGIYAKTKLLIRQTAKYPIATLHTGAYYRNSLVAFFGTTHVSDYYILTLLNATLIRTFYRDKFVESGQQTFPQVKVSSLRQLPFRRIHFTTNTDMRNELASTLTAQAEAMTTAQASLEPLRDVASFRASELGQTIAAMLPVVEPVETEAQGQFLAFKEGATGAEEHSDVVHDLLAHLAQRMLNLNKHKQAEMQRYLSALEMRLNIEHKGKTGIDALAGKTTIQNYLGDYQKGEEEQPWENIHAVLSRNKKKFGVSKHVLEQPHHGQLRADYEASLAMLRPIKAQLSCTHALIDQVVYLLYGLTEDEVRMVAEQGKPR